MQQFQSLQLPYSLARLRSQKFSGVANILVEPPHLNQYRKRVLIFHEGWMTYAGENLITAHEMAHLLGRKFNLPVMESALQLATKKVKNKTSIYDYLALFVRLELFTWEDLVGFTQTKLLGTLEQLIPYAGSISCDPVSLDLHFSEERPGLRWADLQPAYEKRQQQWAALAPMVPSIEGVPRALELASADDVVIRHVRRWIDGHRSIVDIATALTKDPLELAQLYFRWAQKGWLTFGQAQQVAPNVAAPAAIATSPSQAADQPIVLSVDDSPVVQTMIKRAINDRYQVLLADNAVDALNILNSHNVSVILLDVTMPDIDGLDLCRTIRSISKFRDLPVIMLTAKDGMFNKLKGQMAGSTHYLTKPVARDKLLEVLNKYVTTAGKV